jgi:thymidylate synthase
VQRFMTFKDAVTTAFEEMREDSTLVRRDNWQGVNVARRPEMGAHEILHWSMRCPMPVEKLDFYREQIEPNLPWADDHFAERVCGQPINPGIQWANWPWGKSADKFRDETGLFNHNYMERYWPRFAGRVQHATKTAEEYARADRLTTEWQVHTGIREKYGDLNDVVEQLAKDPTTRQAILPVFFPEDTGGAAGGRVPCSIFYHFMLSGDALDKLDVVYYLRSCDLIRHFKDDIYLTVRLLLWVLDRLREVPNDDAPWERVLPGDFVMTIGNLHCFRNDFIQLQGTMR